MLKYIDVPVHVMSEISGKVITGKNEKGKMPSGIKLCIYNDSSVPVACITTDRDGYFNYSGYPSRYYTLRFDFLQLQDRGLAPLKQQVDLNINPGTEGDVVSGIELLQ